MKKILALALTALLVAVLIPNAVMADGITIEVPEEMELPTWNVLDDPGEGYATVEEAAAAIGKTALTGIYTYVNGGEGYGGEGSENLWDNKTGSKYCTGTFPTVSIAQLDGTYKVDGIILATANDNADYNDRSPFEWCVYGSADGVTWTPLAYGDDTFFEEVNFTYFPAALTVDGEYEFIMFYSDGALSGTFQMSECVICGERTGDSKVEAEKVELPAVAEWIDFTAGTPIANNGAEYEDEAAAIASIGKTPIDNVTFVLGTIGNNNEGPENLWDRDNTTKFCTGNAPFISIVELDDTYGIDGIVLSTANDNAEYNGRNPQNWAILGSNDFENWDLIVNGDATFLAETDFIYYAASFEQTGGYKYIAWEAEGAEGGGTFQLAEVVLTGAKAEAAAAAAPAAPELLAKSWDNIFVDGEMMVNGGADGWLASNPIEGDIASLGVRGWSYVSTGISAYAYAIDGGEAVKSADFINDRPDVKAAINEIAEGFDISIDVSGVAEGAHTVKIYAVAPDDTLVDTGFDLPFTKAAPAPVEDVVVTDAPAAEETSPNTFDFGLIALFASVASLAGFAASKSRKH